MSWADADPNRAERARTELNIWPLDASNAALLDAVDELVVALALGLAVTDGGASSPWPGGGSSASTC